MCDFSHEGVLSAGKRKNRNLASHIVTICLGIELDGNQGAGDKRVGGHRAITLQKLGGGVESHSHGRRRDRVADRQFSSIRSVLQHDSLAFTERWLRLDTNRPSENYVSVQDRIEINALSFTQIGDCALRASPVNMGARIEPDSHAAATKHAQRYLIPKAIQPLDRSTD